MTLRERCREKGYIASGQDKKGGTVKEMALEIDLEGCAVFVYVKTSIPGRGLIKREERKGVIYNTISMCTCGRSPGYMRSGAKRFG